MTVVVIFMRPPKLSRHGARAAADVSKCDETTRCKQRKREKAIELA
jgi:hypothetical protein